MRACFLRFEAILAKVRCRAIRRRASLHKRTFMTSFKHRQRRKRAKDSARKKKDKARALKKTRRR